MTRWLRPIVAASMAAGLALWPGRVLTHDTESTTTTVFDREVVGILNRHCVSCHSAGNVAVPLMTYEEAYLHARSIKTQVQQRRMPPWSALAGYGHFTNDNGLTAREIDFLVSWADGGKPRNAGTVFLNDPDSGVARRDVRANADPGFHLATVDLTRRLPPQTIPARSSLVRRVTVDLGLTRERWMQGMKYSPGERRVVRSAVFTLEQTGQWLGSWTPWAQGAQLPSQIALRLPAGARIAAEIQYEGGTSELTDEGTLDLSFGNRPGLNCEGDMTVVASRAAAPGRSSEDVLRGEIVLAQDTWFLAIRPDITPSVTSVQVSVRRPDGGSDVLLFARDVRHDWPTPYVFSEPVVVRRGSRLSVVMHAEAGTAPTTERLIVSRCTEWSSRPIRNVP